MKGERTWEKLSMTSVCLWMDLLPPQMFARRQDWVMAESDYTIGHLTASTRAIVNSWQKERAWVRLFLVDITMIWQYPIGEQMDPPAMPRYQLSLFRTVFPKTYPMEAYIGLPIALKLRLKSTKSGR